MKQQNKIRRRSLLQYGFGIERMQELTVCPNCNSLESSHRILCKNCNAKLPKTTIYDLYKSYHESCPKCKTVLSKSMYYCPNCGVKIKEKYALCAL